VKRYEQAGVTGQRAARGRDPRSQRTR
jgi:hypothetical protein